MKLQRNARLVTVLCLLLLPATAWAPTPDQLLLRTSTEMDG